MNSGEADGYFSKLKSAVAIYDGIKIKRKWAKKKDDVLLEPTPVPSFDQIVERFIPSNEYFGANTKFAPGNLLWRIQLASAYLLKKFDEDFNSFANVVPPEYSPKSWNLDDLVNMSEKPNDNVERNRRKRGNKLTRAVPQTSEAVRERSVTEKENSVNDNDRPNFDLTPPPVSADFSFETSSRASGSPTRQNSFDSVSSTSSRRRANGN